MVEEAPAAPSETSSMPLCASAVRSVPSLPRARATRVSQSAMRSTGVRSVCQLRPGSQRPSPAARSARIRAASGPSAAAVPAAPESETSRQSARTPGNSRKSASSGAPQPATTAPKLVGVACWP